jgi:hypothetical protein
MKFKRPLAILIAYCGGALAASIILCAVFIDEIILKDFSTIITGIATLGSFAAVLALPVSIPVIAFTELRSMANLRFFIGAGAILGLLISMAFNAFVFGDVNLLLTALLLCSSLAGSATYWFIRWKLLRPASDALLGAE